MGITLIAASVSFFMDDVGEVFRFLILIGKGPGLVLLPRWFWWRVNAWAEIVAMLAGLGLALATYLPVFAGLTFGGRLVVTAFGALAVWLPDRWLTPPEPNQVLDRFYARVRPAGAWGRVRARTGLAPADDLGRDLRRWLLWVGVILGGTLGIGWLVLR